MRRLPAVCFMEVLVVLCHALRLLGDTGRSLACLDECMRLWAQMSAGSIHHLIVRLEVVAGLPARQ